MSCQWRVNFGTALCTCLGRLQLLNSRRQFWQLHVCQSMVPCRFNANTASLPSRILELKSFTDWWERTPWLDLRLIVWFSHQNWCIIAWFYKSSVACSERVVTWQSKKEQDNDCIQGKQCWWSEHEEKAGSEAVNSLPMNKHCSSSQGSSKALLPSCCAKVKWESVITNSSTLCST